MLARQPVSRRRCRPAARTWGRRSQPALSSRPGCGLPKRKIENGDPRLEELNLKPPIGDGTGLSDQLVHPWLGDGAIALVVNIGAVSDPRRPSIDEDPEPHRTST